MVWYGMVWYGVLWYGMVWYGTVRYGTTRSQKWRVNMCVSAAYCWLAGTPASLEAGPCDRSVKASDAAHRRGDLCHTHTQTLLDTLQLSLCESGTARIWKCLQNSFSTNFASFELRLNWCVRVLSLAHQFDRSSKLANWWNKIFIEKKSPDILRLHKFQWLKVGCHAGYSECF